ncbi:CDC16 protein [Coemansia sp. RSA 1813]|nr:CDC16 protein [Coemansia sp. RSA 1646]KAJ1769442.1 CDC16 protein [Coemansia sp. RSA 1843]KAJ2086276.1 CDC16 protein [Coemansia sp. RSA 986]KAJ2212935.1 CDC16 protein [Coemansia sp. RSA 487]KAJ2567610.1 CDC16 protein [Coemansia sp. RSA 1813]
MLELSRRLGDIEFEEYRIATSDPRCEMQHPAPHSSPACEIPIREEEDEDEREESSGGQASTASGSEILGVRVRERLRDRLRVPASEPSKLGGLDLVEPAKVDTMYEEDVETSEYRRRRRARESLGSSDGFAVDIALRGRTRSGSGSQQQHQHQHQQDAAMALTSMAAARERQRLVALTRRIHEDWEEVSNTMRELRVLIATSGGLPVSASDGRLRRTLWLAMLEVRDINVDGYARALQCCPSTSADKIDNDAFRTLAADGEFRRRVSTDSIVRVLNALLSAPDRATSDPPRYVQGMNTLAAPFLYVMGEGAGFFAFRQFLRKECPLYARPSLPGVHACVQLVDECLAHVDPRLFSHLRRHGAVAKIYAFPAAMTLSASVGPLRQVVRLWDFLLAFGVHLNVVCIVAQLLSMRELLLTTPSPMAFLRSWPPLRADSVIRRTREIYDLLPDSLRRRIKFHAHDPHLAETLASAPQIGDPLASPILPSPQHQNQPQHPQPSLSLKRDLPLSPTSNPPNHGFLSPRNASSTRPRARTFSGMAKRLRTAPSAHLPPLSLMGLTNVPLTDAYGSSGGGGLALSPSYGAVGLGLHVAGAPAPSPTTPQMREFSPRYYQQPVQQQDPSAQQRIPSNTAIQSPRRQQLLPMRGLRLPAGSEAMWLIERKLSPESN